MKITKRQLQRLQACTEQVNLFATEWPEGCEVSEQNALRAIELGLDIDWLAKNVLTGDKLAEYEKVCAPAWAEYKKVRDQALAEYYKVCAMAFVRLVE